MAARIKDFVRFILILFAWLLLTDIGAKFTNLFIDQVNHLSNNYNNNYQNDDNKQFIQEEELFNNWAEMFTSHCLPKVVCELFANDRLDLTPGERSLISLLEATTSMSESGPTRYHYAAHMGYLINGIQGRRCEEFFPMCPFDGSYIRQITSKIIN